MNQISALKQGAVVLAVLSLAGCGGGGSGPATSTPTVNVSTQNLTPSLGQFDDNTHVVIYSDLNETTRLGEGFITNGRASIDIGAYRGAYVAVIDGADPLNANKGYYDEALHQRQLLGTRQLRALNPDNTQNQSIGVTVLTELAAKYYKTHFGAALTAANVTVSNAVIQAAIKNAPPLLTPPALVGDSTPSNSLDWNGSDQEKYALILAALAQSENSSGGNKTAANLIEDMGSDSDLAAGKVNVPANFSQQLQTAATTYANAATRMQMATPAFAVANNVSSSSGGSSFVAVNLVAPTSITTAPGSDVAQAKNTFANLRSAKLALNNTSTASPGFYQTTGQQIVNDVQTNVRKHGAHFVDATLALVRGAQLLRDISAGNTSGYVAHPTNGLPVLNGTLGSGTEYSTYTNNILCYVDVPDGVSPTSVTTAECEYNWGDVSYLTDSAGNPYPVWSLDTIVINSTSTPGSFSYQATAAVQQYTSTTTSSGTTGSWSYAPVGTAVNGTVGLTLTGSQVTGGVISGQLPIDATANSPGDTASISVNVTRTDNGGGQLTYSLDGSYNYKSSGSPVLSFTANGSQIVTQTDSTTGRQQLTSALLKGVLQTAAFEYDGTVTLKDFQADKSNTAPTLTSARFDGDIKDRSQPATASPVFNGTLMTQIQDYNTFDATQPESGTNFRHVTASLGGALTIPNQTTPMTLTLGLDRTGWRKVHVSLDYAFGPSHLFGVTDVLSPNGSNPADSDQVMTVNSSDGVKITLTRLASNGDVIGQVNISTFNPLVGNISGNYIHYRDGSFESLF